MKVKFIVIAPNYWGKGDTPEKALTALRKEMGRALKSTEPRLWYVTNDPDAHVDDFGALCYHTTEGLWVTRCETSGHQEELWPWGDK